MLPEGIEEIEGRFYVRVNKDDDHLQLPSFNEPMQAFIFRRKKLLNLSKANNGKASQQRNMTLKAPK